MKKITTILSAAFLAVSVVCGKHLVDPKKWPAIKTHTTFKAETTLHFIKDLLGRDLGPYSSASAQILVDSDRNQAVINGKLTLPVGKFDARVLLDLNKGSALINLPDINLCQRLKFNSKLNLKEILTETFNPEGNITRYIDDDIPHGWRDFAPQYRLLSIY